MPKTTRNRVDYMPGAAACTALALAATLFPKLRTQELLDKLVITAVSALQHEAWEPPSLCGRDRDKWRLPASMTPEDT